MDRAEERNVYATFAPSSLGSSQGSDMVRLHTALLTRSNALVLKAATAHEKGQAVVSLLSDGNSC